MSRDGSRTSARASTSCSRRWRGSARRRERCSVGPHTMPSRWTPAFRRMFAVPSAPRYATVAAWLLAALILASVAGVAWQLSRVPGALAAAARPLLWSYYTALDRLGVIEGAKLAEGLGLAAATIV